MNLLKPVYLNGHRKDVSIYGFFNPLSWGEDDIPTKFSIYTDEEEDIVIHSSLSWPVLKNYCGKRVEAHGTLGVDEDGNTSLHLKKIKELKGPANSAQTQVGYMEEASLALPLRFDNEFSVPFDEAC
jgi:hypothetical protein